MNKRELNLEWKRLYVLFSKWYGKETPEHISQQIEAEWKRLYYADNLGDYMNKFSIMSMIRINQAKRFKALHIVGMNFKPNNK